MGATLLQVSHKLVFQIPRSIEQNSDYSGLFPLRQQSSQPKRRLLTTLGNPKTILSLLCRRNLTTVHFESYRRIIVRQIFVLFVSWWYYSEVGMRPFATSPKGLDVLSSAAAVSSKSLVSQSGLISEGTGLYSY